ncbi:MAG: hypothetical protein ACYC0X_32920 [Pirellulaceae bacterium]
MFNHKKYNPSYSGSFYHGTYGQKESGHLARLIHACFVAAFIFFVLHFESLSIGPLKIAQAWKIGLVFVLIEYLRSKEHGRVKVDIHFPLILLALLQLVNLEMFINPMNGLRAVFITLFLPVVGMSLASLPPNKLKRLLLFCAVLVVLSFIPYQIGLLNSLGKKLDMASYGAADVHANVGVFQTPHSASSTLAMSFLVLLHFWFLKRYNRLALFVLLILCSYFLFNTYVRTGVAMVIIGSAYILWRYLSASPKKFLGSAIGVCVISSCNGVGVWQPGSF